MSPAAKKKTTVKHAAAKPKKKSAAKKSAAKQHDTHIMSKPRVGKITINIGVGESGEKLSKAQTVLKNITGLKPVQTLSRTTSKDWGLREGMPIGCKVTLRGKKAVAFLTEALKIRSNQISDYTFDQQGNFSFGIPDHTLFKDQKYDPSIGIFGMDICVTVEKPGFRIKHRRIDRRHIPLRHQVSPEETMQFLKETYSVEVVE
jgi:large subunit ribosomal protein L5